MQSVMISIQPVWVEKILNGEKTIEVRKSKPKLQVPFKCYIYCTKSGGHYKHIYVNEKDVRNKYGVADHWSKKQQMVEVNGSKNNPNNYLAYKCFLAEGNLVGEFTCDRIDFIANIATDKWELLQGNVHEQHKRIISENACLIEQQCISYGGKYAWHISALVVYDEPKELSEFYVENGATTDYPQLTKLKRPPKSWCYVDETTREV